MAVRLILRVTYSRTSSSRQLSRCYGITASARYHRSHANPLLAGFTERGSHHKSSGEQLISAVKDNDIRTVKKLLDSGVDVNCRHYLGWNGLHTATVNGNTKMMKLLIQNGADVDAKDEFSSALRIALQQNIDSSRVLLEDIEVVKFLLDSGADPNSENNRGHIPMDYTTSERMKSLFREYESKFEDKKKLEQLEERRRFPLEAQLKKYIVGQEGPITAAAAAIRRREMGWADDEHPMVLLFLGSSGIGKTEMAKQIAKYLHKDNKKGFIRLDMSEYQEKHEVAKLIGSPPGYIGHDKGGQLTSHLRECPNAVVLFDEVEKAHPDVLTVMLQLFDEGRLTDGQGNTIECKDALFVMTSNLASDEIAAHGLKLRRQAQQAAETYHDGMEVPDPQTHIQVSRDFKDRVVEPILKRHFKRDEFLGRINEMLYFLPFSRSELNTLVEKQLEMWKEKAMQKHSICLTWEREALDVLTDGYNVKYGARSIKHEVERVLVTQLADAFEKRALSGGDEVCVMVKSDETKGAAMLYLNINKQFQQTTTDKTSDEDNFDNPF